MNIANLFIETAKKHPKHVAIIDKGRSITFEQLQKDVERTASYFKNKGITKGDRVLVFVPMSIDLYRTVLALFYIGTTAVFLDEWVNKKRLELCCELADCKGFISGTKVRLLSIFSRELRRIPIKLSLRTKENTAAKLTDVEPTTPALITFTTGSTGTPKAALRSHGFLHEQFRALLHEIQPEPTDVDMPVLPIVLFVNLGVGCTSVIADFKMSKPDKLNPQKILSQLQRHKVNRITASPFFIKSLARHLTENEQHSPRLEKIFTGGAPVFPVEAALYKEAFPNTKIVIAYGSTEAEPMSSIEASTLLNSSDLDQGLHVGTVYKDARIRIISIRDEAISISTNEELSTLCLPEGEIGEIIVSGPHVLEKYFNNQEAFERNKIVVDGVVWHRTGDAGKLLSNQLYLLGRCAQLIFWEDQVISPFIVEPLLSQITQVSIGTVLKINEELHVILESNQPIAKEHIPPLPFEYTKCHVLNNIPRDPRHHSKIDYAALKQKVQQRTG